MKASLRPIALVMAMTVSTFADDRRGEIELEGIVQELPSQGLIGIWRVSERPVAVTEGTLIKEDDGPVRVGAKVEVEGSLEPNGTIAARKIETED